MLNRRKLLKGAGAAALSTALPGLSFGVAPGDARFVLVVLRGALDSLAAVPAYGDGNYRRLRGELALDAPGSSEGLLKLDGTFGLHPALTNMHRWYEAGDLNVVHAVASPYRSRSHFDGQDLLENGAPGPGVVRDGWLNRAIQVLPANQRGDEIGIALAQNVPLVLLGDERVSSWAPSQLPDANDDTMQRIADMYSQDDYFAGGLADALAAQDLVKTEMSEADTRRMGRRRRGPALFKTLSEAAGKFLRAEDGPRIAVLESTGWDTHANQGATTGQLATRLRGLDQGLEMLAKNLGDAWDTTAVVVVTEFGRTVAVNGTRGTDHGTGGCALVLGGAVAGGRVISDWPGLSNSALYQGRDLQPTTDLRALFKGVLHKHLDLGESALEDAVFPNSRNAKPLMGLI